MITSEAARWERWLGVPGGGPEWLEPARRALEGAPDPGHAVALAAEALACVAESQGDKLTGLARSRPGQLAAILYALAGVAPFFAPMLRTHPDWLLRLLSEDLDRRRERADLDPALDMALASGGDATAGLRRFKYYELARITVRDCSEHLVPLADSVVTLREISQLADCLLGRAFDAAAATTRERFGPPRWALADGREVDLSFAVLGMGKLGADELNYSSDVDIVYVFELPPGELLQGGGEGLADLTPADYYTRLAQRFGKLVADSTAEGFLYRIDLDLRPDGPQGTLVCSDEALALYYESWADTWEKATFMKARPVAGDLQFGWRVVRSVDPMIYRSTMDFRGVQGIADLKVKIEQAHGNRREGINVKIDSGGIRDVEFVPQAMQLLHGGRFEQIRARSTVDGLQALREVHLLPDEHVNRLLGAYLFLRRVENRLQMVSERQTHRLPRDPTALRHLARAMGYLDDDGTARFTADLSACRERVSGIFHRFFFDHGSDRILDLLTRSVPQLFANPTTRAMLEELAQQFAREVDASADTERALNNLDRFVRGVGGRRFYYELLLDRPELVGRLAALFGASNFLSAVLATHPTQIEPVFRDPGVLLLDRSQLDADFDAMLAERGAAADDEEANLDTLRLFFHRQVLNVGLLDLGGHVARAEVEHALTQIAEVCLDRALRFSQAWLAIQRPQLARIVERTRFLVVGMGKLASDEISYGSDLDLIFIYDVRPDEPEDEAATPALDAQEYSSRLAQRLMTTLQTRTSQGACYEVDTRLRPSGNQGTLVSSLAAFERYHARTAETWERIALLRARPVGGDEALGQRFEAIRREVLRRPLPPGAAEEVRRIRGRMEVELANETGGRRDFKRGRGGMLDVENITQWLQLQGARDHDELLDALPLEQQLRRLGQHGLLDAAQVVVLAAGWDFLQRLSNRLRVVENRSISDLNAERGDLEGVARAMGYQAPDDAQGAALRDLLNDYRQHTEAVREVYEAVIGQPNGPGG